MATKRMLVTLDMTGNQVKNVLLDVLSTDPSSPAEGQWWYNSTTQVVKYKDATAIRTVGTSAGVANAYSSFSDGTNQTHAIGADVLTLTSGNNILGILANDSGAGSDTVTFTVDLGNFDTRVRTSRLDQMAVPTAAVSMNGQRVTNVGTPTSSTDAINKAYADGVRQGTDWKNAVKAASGANVSVSAAPSTIDGVTLVAGDRILLFGQTTAAQNGIWNFVATGSPLTRAADAAQNGDLDIGSTTYVEAGSTFIGRSYVVTAVANTPWVPGTDSSTWTQAFGATTTTAGAGLVQNGVAFDVGTVSTGRIVVNANNIDLALAGTAGTYTSVTTDAYGRVTLGVDIITANGIVTRTAAGTFVNRSLAGTSNRVTVTNVDGVAGNPTIDIHASYAGQTSINMVGTIATGVWQGTIVGLTYGGTGAATAAAARGNLGAVGKYSALIGDGSATSIAITQGTHGLASDRTNSAIVMDASTGDTVDCLINYGSSGTVTFNFNTAPVASSLRVVIMG